MMARVRGPGLVIALAIASPAVLAQSSAKPEAEPPPRYTVEVVVFSQPAVDETEGEDQREAPATSPTPLPPGLTWPLRAPDTDQLGYPRLPAADESLARATRRIDDAPGFRVLWHAGWRQPGLAEGESQRVAVPTIESMPGLDGFIQVYRERFVHARVELRQRVDADTHWRLSQARRLRGDDPHYFDHPALGVIIRVERLEENAGAD